MKRYSRAGTVVQRFTYSIVVTLLSTVQISSAFAAGEVRTVALTGQHLPGLPADVTFASSLLFKMNNHGQVLVTGHLSGTGVTAGNNDALWLDTPGAEPEFIVREGQQAPGSLAGINFFDLNVELPDLNDAGHVQIRSFLLDSTGANRISNKHPGDDNIGDWIWRPNMGIVRLAVGQDRTPTLNHGFIVEGLAINQFDQQLRGAQITPFIGGSTDSLWLLAPDAQPQLIAARGAPAHGMPSGVVYGQFTADNLGSTGAANTGQIFYRGKVTGPGIDSTNNEAVWLRDAAGNVKIISRVNEQAPGLPAGVLYDIAAMVRVSDSGRVTLSNVLRGTGINSSNNVGLWSGADVDHLEFITRKGEPAPGTPAGTVFNQLISNYATNAPGQFVFAGSLVAGDVQTGNKLGLWTFIPGEGLKMIARDGSPAPGGEPGTVFNLHFDSTDSSWAGGAISLNDHGQILFRGRLAGPGITSANDGGIWAQGQQGALQLVVRDGQQLDVDNGPGIDLRTIADLTSTLGPTLNNLGQAVFRAKFTDGTEGIFVSNVFAVPEPGVWMMLTTAVFVWACCRERVLKTC